jgi:hypothetical protein
MGGPIPILLVFLSQRNRGSFEETAENRDARCVDIAGVASSILATPTIYRFPLAIAQSVKPEPLA